MPYLTPDTLPVETICRVLKIPNDPEIIADVTGAIQELTFPYNWEKYGAITPTAIASAMFDMFDGFCFEQGTCRMIGEIITYAGATSPTADWLACDGASVLRADYPDLFAVIGTNYGSVDGLHFNVPDLRGRVPIGISASHALASSGGSETVTLTVAEMPAHTHSDSGHLHTVANQGVFLELSPPVGVFPSAIPTPGLTGSASANIQNTGGDAPHNNMQPFLAINYFIVAQE